MFTDVVSSRVVESRWSCAWEEDVRSGQCVGCIAEFVSGVRPKRQMKKYDQAQEDLLRVFVRS